VSTNLQVRPARRAPLYEREAQDPSGRPALHRWGVYVARHRRLVLGVWTLLILGCSALLPSLQSVLSAPDYGVEGSQSWRVERLLAHYFPGIGSEQDAVVFYSRKGLASEPAYRATVTKVLGAVRGGAGVVRVVGPYGRGVRGAISADGHAAIATVGLSGGARERFKHAADLQSAVGQAARGDVHAWLTGGSPVAKALTLVETPDTSRAEMIGIPVALVILLLALGTLVAALVPLALAGAGLLLTFGVIALLGRVLTFDAFLLSVVTMIGLGIGIDYALFVVSRFREELARLPPTPRRERRRVAEAVGAALATSGRTILYSGVIVGLSLTSPLVIDAPLFREFAVGALTVVLCTLAAALTLLPAVLATIGARIERGALSARLQPADTRPQAVEGQGGWARWALAIMRHPVPAVAGVGALLLLAMTPLLGLRYGIDQNLSALSATPSGRGALVLARSFSPGALEPIEVLVTSPQGRLGRRDLAAVATLARELRRDSRVSGLTVRRSASGALITIATSVSVDSSSADALVQRIRSKLAVAARARGGPSVLVGGSPAESVDISAETSAKLPLVLAITLGLSLLFLLIVFRSVVLPIKAVAMNLLATGATLGLVVLVFQDGSGEHLLGFSSPGFVQTYLPLSVFVLLFGLSMDYEVFLIRRMQEVWLRTGENRLAVASGLEHTARPISAAAAIMVAVFGSFLTADVLELKEIGFALATAIAIDATLVRLILVPALMRLFGAWNWWTPAWLGSLLPRLELD
jgi:RND superfamily putative drug exporter